MKPKMRRNFSGTFMARDLGRGSWRLSGRGPACIDVLLKDAPSGTADALRPGAVSDIELEWQDGAVLTSLTSAQGRTSITLQSAIVHEPLAHLYEKLPLAELDTKARRFWRRIFALVRIPGGRYLLDVLARRTRSRV